MTHHRRAHAIPGTPCPYINSSYFSFAIFILHISNMERRFLLKQCKSSCNIEAVSYGFWRKMSLGSFHFAKSYYSSYLSFAIFILHISNMERRFFLKQCKSNCNIEAVSYGFWRKMSYWVHFILPSLLLLDFIDYILFLFPRCWTD